MGTQKKIDALSKKVTPIAHLLRQIATEQSMQKVMELSAQEKKVADAGQAYDEVMQKAKSAPVEQKQLRKELVTLLGGFVAAVKLSEMPVASAMNGFEEADPVLQASHFESVVANQGEIGGWMAWTVRRSSEAYTASLAKTLKLGTAVTETTKTLNGEISKLAAIIHDAQAFVHFSAPPELVKKHLARKHKSATPTPQPTLEPIPEPVPAPSNSVPAVQVVKAAQLNEDRAAIALKTAEQRLSDGAGAEAAAVGRGERHLSRREDTRVQTDESVVIGSSRQHCHRRGRSTVAWVFYRGRTLASQTLAVDVHRGGVRGCARAGCRGIHRERSGRRVSLARRRRSGADTPFRVPHAGI